MENKEQCPYCANGGEPHVPEIHGKVEPKNVIVKIKETILNLIYKK